MRHTVALCADLGKSSGAPLNAATPKSAGKPNVLCIVVDDLHPQIGCHDVQRHFLANPCRALRTDGFLNICNFDPANWRNGESKTPKPEMDFTDGSWPSHDGAFSFNIDPSPKKQFLLDHRDEPVVKPIFAMACGPRPEEEIYDLNTDPDQLRNIAGDPKYAPAKARLAARLEAELRASQDPFLKARSINPAKP